jgi:hypothetical protein
MIKKRIETDVISVSSNGTLLAHEENFIAINKMTKLIFKAPVSAL